MTPEMVFECLLVSHDPIVFCIMHRVLRDFSITTNICLTATKATDMLEEGSADLIVIDWDDDESSADLVHHVSASRLKQKPTILAVAANDRARPGVHVLLQKPVTPESVTRSMHVAYSRMLEEFRRHVRYAVMAPVRATDDNHRTIPVIVTNIGDGGVGLSTREKISVGDVLSFSLLLQGAAKEISIQARVLWTRHYGAAGCEFLRIPPFDLQILHDWLTTRCRIKRPVLNVGRSVCE